MRALILVVDDDEELRGVLAQFLSTEGYAVVTASNGAEALEELRGSRTPSIVLMDLEMPVMSGWQVLATLRQDPDLASLPVIVVSGANVDLAKIPAAGHFKKPIDLDGLRELVARLLTQKDSSPRVSAPVLGRVSNAGQAEATFGTAEPLAAGPEDAPIVAEEEPAAGDPAPPAGDKFGDP